MSNEEDDDGYYDHIHQEQEPDYGDDLIDDDYVPGYDDPSDELYRRTTVARKVSPATVWQKLCSYEPSYIMRVEKYTQYILERHCSRYIGRSHSMQPAKPNVFRRLVFRIAAWLEFRVHNHLRKIKESK